MAPGQGTHTPGRGTGKTVPYPCVVCKQLTYQYRTMPNSKIVPVCDGCKWVPDRVVSVFFDYRVRR